MKYDKGFNATFDIVSGDGNKSRSIFALMSSRGQVEADYDIDKDEMCDSDYLSDHNRNYIDMEHMAIDISH